MTKPVLRQFVRHLSLTSKNLKVSTGAWLNKHVNDEYVKKSRYENYRARSAFKLIEIDQKYDIIRPGYLIIDLGASPGSWSQVAARIMRLNKEPSNLKAKSHTKKDLKNGLIISVDLLPINPIDGVVTIGNVDFTKPLNQAKIITLLNDRKVDLIMSDMAPNASGCREIDIPNIIRLAESSLKFGIQVLKPNTGAYLTKLWGGAGVEEFREEQVGKYFESVRFVRPPSTKADSSELFLLATNFEGINQARYNVI